MLSTFPGEEALEKYSAQWLRNSNFNEAVKRVDKPDRDHGIACYVSRNGLLTLYMEKSKSSVLFTSRRAATDA